MSVTTVDHRSVAQRSTGPVRSVLATPTQKRRHLDEVARLLRRGELREKGQPTLGPLSVTEVAEIMRRSEGWVRSAVTRADAVKRAVHEATADADELAP